MLHLISNIQLRNSDFKRSWQGLEVETSWKAHIILLMSVNGIL
jgi:hypothetical protein